MDITLLDIAQHFSLFTLHFSLPLGTTFHFSLFTFHFPKGALFTLHFSLFTSRRDAFHFPKGPLCTFHSSLFTSRRGTFNLYHAVRCIGQRSALHWALQCAAQAVAVRCVFRCTFMHGRGHAAKGSFPEDRKQKCCAMRYTAQHCLPYTFSLYVQPAQTYARQKDFRSDLFTTAPAFLRVSFPIPKEQPWAASSMLLPHPLEQGV